MQDCCLGTAATMLELDVKQLRNLHVTPHVIIELIHQLLRKDSKLKGAVMLTQLEDMLKSVPSERDVFLTRNQMVEAVLNRVQHLERDLYEPPVCGVLTDEPCNRCAMVTKQFAWSIQMRGGDEPETRFTRCTVCHTQTKF